MIQNDVLTTVLNHGYEGVVEFYGGDVSTIRFWHPDSESETSEETIPVEVIKTMKRGTGDAELKASLQKLLDWWENDRGKYSGYFWE